MAKTIYICFKTFPKAKAIEKDLRLICDKLAPDNIIPNEPLIKLKESIAFGIMNPNSTLNIVGNSLLLGHLIGDTKDWHVPRSEFPDGSYAIFRDNNNYFEALSDPVASRTIWYYMDENVFVASTSQRAIIMFIGSFEFEERTIPWMLSTGTLGPTFSWDKRVNRLPGDSSIILDKKEWSITRKSNPIEFKCTEGTSEKHESRLREALASTFKTLKLDYSSWILPLSGGYDSRGILLFLIQNQNIVRKLRTITWDLKSSVSTITSDLYIARKVAKTVNVSHKYFHVDLSDEPFEKVIHRFLALGEGRIDHLSGYMDGFKTWKTLFDYGIEGIIRGDEGFGWYNVSSPLTVRLKIGCGLCTDFSNLENYLSYHFPYQEFPLNLKKREKETIHEWRDRLYQEYRIPTILSALSDLKLSYIEQISPLLAKQILVEVRKIPDYLRNNKIVFKRIVKSLSPKIDFSITDKITLNRELLKKKRIVRLLQNEISSTYAKMYFSEEFLKIILKGLITKNETKKKIQLLPILRFFISKCIPESIKNALRDNLIAPKVDYNILAFRVLIITKMNKLLILDSKVTKSIER